MIRITRTVGNHPEAVGIAGAIAALAVILLPFLFMLSSRKAALDHAREVSENFSSIMALDLERAISLYDTQLQVIVHNAEDPRTWKLPADIRDRLLFRNYPADAYVDGQFILGPAGQVLASKHIGKVSRELVLSDRTYFLAHQNNPSLGLFVSHPFRSRVSGAKPSIAMTRRINRPDGSFGGIAFFQIRLEFAQRLFDRINTEATGGVVIILDDGTILARKPYSDKDVGASIANLPVFKKNIANPNSSAIGIGIDGVTRLFTYRHIPDYPLIAIVAPSVDEVMAEWRRQNRITTSVAVAFGVVLATGSWLLAYTLRDKLRAQDELARLATTDPLTKLSNRRLLEERLRQEWGRARRERSFLSILFIDVDRFKLFNDTYGHAAGDEVLAKVAECIASSARRSIDVVARYGGEEFTAVFPDMDHEGAVRLAESIRSSVQTLGIPHQGSDIGVVTVSIGCATGRPSDATAEKLLAAADEQLYRAKSSGRNQVQSIVIAETPQENVVSPA